MLGLPIAFGMFFGLIMLGLGMMNVFAHSGGPVSGFMQFLESLFGWNSNNDGDETGS